MKTTSIWTCVLLSGLVTLATSLSSEHTIVFPRLLENRDVNGQNTLVVNEDITLQLTPSSVFAEEFTVDTIEKGSPVKYYFQGQDYERNLYHDNQHKAALTIREDNGIHVEGLIGSSLRIKPALGVGRSSEGHVAHKLYRVQSSVSPQLNQKGVRKGGRVKRSVSESALINNSSFPTERQDGTFVAEVFLVLERSYSKANMYLSSIGSQQFSVKIVGLKIRKERDTYLTKMKGKQDKLLADETLERFRSTFQNTKEYKESDAFMLITRLDIAEGDEKSYDDTVTGFSMIGGACNIYKASFFEDEPNTYYGVYAFVREVSHLFGIVDDGKEPYSWIPGNTGARNCPPTRGYIMGTPDAANENIHYNHYYYSDCSKRQFEEFVRNKKNHDCLITLNFKSTTEKMKQKVFPHKYDMKYICQIMHDDYAHVTYVPNAGRLEQCRFRCASPKDFRGRFVTFDHFVEEGAPCDGGRTKGRGLLFLALLNVAAYVKMVRRYITAPRRPSETQPKVRT